MYKPNRNDWNLRRSKDSNDTDGTNSIVVISGAYSTGKTRLLNELKNHYGDRIHYIKEGAREVIEEAYNGKVDELNPVELKDLQLDLLEKQIRDESYALKNSPVTISDSSLIEIHSYSHGLLDKSILDTIERFIETRRGIYEIIHCSSHALPLEKDGLRHEDELFRHIIDHRIQQMVQCKQLPVINLLTADFNQRMRVAVDYIDNVLRRHGLDSK